jgi:hypothetical protein
MVEKPEEYPHSSYVSYISDMKEEIVTIDMILALLTKNRVKAGERYRTFVEGALVEELKSPMEKVYGGVMLGDESFIRNTLSRMENNQLEGVEVSHRKALRASIEEEKIISELCKHYGCTLAEIVEDRRSEARKAGVYLLKKYSSATNAEIGEKFGGLSYSAVAKIYQSFSRKVEEDKGLEKRLKNLLGNISTFKG